MEISVQDLTIGISQKLIFKSSEYQGLSSDCSGKDKSLSNLTISTTSSKMLLSSKDCLTQLCFFFASTLSSSSTTKEIFSSMTVHIATNYSVNKV